MTYGTMKNLVSGLLIGDNVMPKEDDVVLALLSYAYNIIGTKAEALHLLTDNSNANILRMATGGLYSRVPELPTSEDDRLDIDDELGFVAARLIAGMLSKTKAEIHNMEAERMIMDYNSKVNSIIEDMKFNETEKKCELS